MVQILIKACMKFLKKEDVFGLFFRKNNEELCYQHPLSNTDTNSTSFDISAGWPAKLDFTTLQTVWVAAAVWDPSEVVLKKGCSAKRIEWRHRLTGEVSLLPSRYVKRYRVLIPGPTSEQTLLMLTNSAASVWWEEITPNSPSLPTKNYTSENLHLTFNLYAEIAVGFIRP